MKENLLVIIVVGLSGHSGWVERQDVGAQGLKVSHQQAPHVWVVCPQAHTHSCHSKGRLMVG
jgi:hypothetical protein